MKLPHLITIIGILSLWSSLSSGQDLHYSQFANSPLNLNPGLTGNFHGDMRFVADFRPQWYTVPVSYLQFSTSVDGKFFNKKRNGPLSAGLIFNYDQAGDLQLTLTQLNVNTSYAIKMDQDGRNVTTIGASVGGIQRNIDFFRIRTDAQYNGIVFDDNLPTGESSNKQSVLLPDVSLGVNTHLAAKENRSTLDFGLGVFHMNQPTKSLLGLAEVKLERRYSAYLLGVKNLNSHLDALFQITYQQQGQSKEIVSGLGIRKFLIQRTTKVLALDLFAYYRAGDAIIPNIGVHYNGWQVNLSYDMNVSQFTEATRGFGGLEISMIYVITEVPFASYCPHCPAFL